MSSFEDKNKKINIDVSETDGNAFTDLNEQTSTNLLNSDGTFNIERRGHSASNIYETILNLSWIKLIFLFLFFYFFINSIFAFIFLAIGPHCVQGIEIGSFLDNYTQMLFYSIQTFTTVGYGQMSPHGNAANLLSSLVAFAGLLSFAIVTGMSFTKFSKPQANILFSDNILIAPNKNGKPSLQFRIVNTSKNQIIDLEARITLAWIENENGRLRRKFVRLDLELETIHLFPLNWTICHLIDENSPLYNLTKKEMVKKQMEILILVKGFDDTYSQGVHVKRSYSCGDLITGARFVSMYENTKENTILHLSKLNEYEAYEF